MDQLTLRSRQERMVGETRVIPVGRRSWLVPSQTRAGLWHAVEMQEDESLSCSCEAANFAPINICRHRNMVTEVLGPGAPGTRTRLERDRQPDRVPAAGRLARWQDHRRIHEGDFQLTDTTVIVGTLRAWNTETRPAGNREARRRERILHA